MSSDEHNTNTPDDIRSAIPEAPDAPLSDTWFKWLGWLALIAVVHSIQVESGSYTFAAIEWISVAIFTWTVSRQIEGIVLPQLLAVDVKRMRFGRRCAFFALSVGMILTFMMLVLVSVTQVLQTRATVPCP